MLFLFLVALLVGFILFLMSQKPSNDRDWAPEGALLPFITREDDTITLRHIRRFRYEEDGALHEDHFDRTLFLHDIIGVDLFIEPFSPVRGPAHSLLSFRISDGHHIVISVEVRRQKKQRESSFWLSFFRQYGLFYVVADEEDAVYLRSHIRKDRVYLHPLRLTPSQSRSLFLHILPRINELHRTPELYNLFHNTCSTNIRDHLNAILDRPIPFHWSLLLPAFLPKFLYKNGLIDTELPFEEHVIEALTNKKPDQYPGLSYSEAIRKK